MKISSLYIGNYRTFESLGLEDISSAINVFIGKNNSGKSNILKTIAVLQYPELIDRLDCRERIQDIVLNYKFDFYDFKYLKSGNYSYSSQEEIDNLNIKSIQYYIDINDRSFLQTIVGEKGGQGLKADSNLTFFPPTEPMNLLYYFPSNRKVRSISHGITRKEAQTLSSDFLNLYGRVDNLLGENSERGEQLKFHTKDILGFEISSIPSDKGKQTCYRVGDDNFISIEQMGEGVLNILYLLTLLFSTKGKIFLIEELENDLHPEALKKLLKLIIEKSDENQFFISTHSHIILKVLGAQNKTNIYSVEQEFKDRLPTTKVSQIANDPYERRLVLESLGYDLTDFDLAKHWIIFEESSAERIIVQYLIPWFAKDLAFGLKTVSANGAQEIENKAKALNDLFLFLHLEPVFKNRVWMIADGDSIGIEVMQKTREKFSTYAENHFINWKEEQFERYYPSEFQTDIEKVLSIENKRDRRNGKKELIDQLIDWIDKDQVKAKMAFEESACEVIQILKQIESSIHAKS
ncbi:ATP-dependent nuclease [Leptospira sp. 'Mane']|uniref:ATP-dependent nuclease n=1 Tax=Leptospira sp. 'Mane' TaxID=3387407 RepID=UPI00398B3B28